MPTRRKRAKRQANNHLHFISIFCFYCIGICIIPMRTNFSENLSLYCKFDDQHQHRAPDSSFARMGATRTANRSGAQQNRSSARAVVCKTTAVALCLMRFPLGKRTSASKQMSDSVVPPAFCRAKRGAVLLAQNSRAQLTHLQCREIFAKNFLLFFPILFSDTFIFLLFLYFLCEWHSSSTAPPAILKKTGSPG